jgi:hypothetical protein
MSRKLEDLAGGLGMLVGLVLWPFLVYWSYQNLTGLLKFMALALFGVATVVKYAELWLKIESSL